MSTNAAATMAIHHRFADSAFPLGVFAISRAALFLLAYFSLIFLPMNPQAAWQPYRQNLFLDGWIRWDAGWYTRIAEGGYNNLPIELNYRDTAFFPMYPLAIAGAKVVLQDTYLSGILISNLAFLIALVILFHLIRDRYGSAIAERSIVLLVVFPFSYYFSAVYTESLFLLTVVGAFYFGTRKRWVYAGLCAAMSAATREVGVLTIVGLVVLYLEQIDFAWRKIRPNILWIALGAIGLLSYAVYFGIRFGNPLQFVTSHVDSGWQAGVAIGLVLDAARSLTSLRSIAAGSYPALNVAHLSMCGIVVILTVMTWRLLRPSDALWTTLMVLISVTRWDIMGRLTIVIFPLFIVAAMLLKDERKYQSVLYISTLFLALFTILFTHSYWVA